ncbi:PqqD family protein [Ruminococcaceae bacterium OttesenSCG-928-I18]|nr:PqqD family protein [Ruminococcaceae bacterium OttesenSCG-928-I18]
MAIRIKSGKNLMDFVPRHNPRFPVESGKEGKICILVPRDNPIEKIVRVFRKTPDYLRVDLDDYGSFVWRCIDGQRDIHEIGNLLLAEYGESIEPVYERLGQFMNLLKNNKFITYHYKK